MGGDKDERSELPVNGSDDDSVKAIRAELAKEHKIDPPPDPKEGK